MARAPKFPKPSLEDAVKVLRAFVDSAPNPGKLLGNVGNVIGGATSGPAIHSVELHPSTKAGFLVEFGNRDGDDRPDTTITAFGTPPDSKGLRKIGSIGPVNAPLNEAEAVIKAAIAASPAPPAAKAMASGLSAMLFAVLRKSAG